MIAERQQCLDRTTLADLLSGKLPTERFASAMEHMDACEQCQQAAEEQSSAQGPWLIKPDGKQSAGEFDGESQCQAIVGQLLVNMPSQVVSPPAGTMDDRVPRELLGPYRLLRRLGSGGMGAVYLAEHQRLKKQVAIKLLPRDKLIQSGWLERFNREMTSVAALEHPHIVRALDAGDEDSWHYLVMEYLEGLDLARVCRRLPEVSVGAACECIRQAALGLSAIHSAGMIHRDIKPSNLFLTPSGNLKLLDLGLVLDGQSPLATDERLTTVGHLMGTLPYMSREQLSDARAIDHRADLYSLGATLHRLLVGRPPFYSDSLPQTIQAISTHDCQPIASHRTDLPQELCTLVDLLLSHDVDQRPPSADTVADALLPFSDSVASGQWIQAAMRCDPANDEVPSLYSHDDFILPSQSSPPSGRWWWLLGLGLPLTFLAGILLTLTTDRGTLTIQTDTPGVSVKVIQGDELVESLVVEQSAPNQVRLRSGRYAVELDGVASDRLTISDQEVAITRGDEVIVRVTQRETSTASLPPDEGELIKLFQGNPLSHWMEVLVRDQDNETLGLAMQAVVLLAETDQEKLIAAKQLLLPARRLGGVVSGSRPTGKLSSSTNLSEWFMTDLLQWYPSLFPKAGLEAIIAELDQGTEHSFSACGMLLLRFEHPYGLNQTSHAQDYYQTLGQSETGRQQLHKLDQSLAKGVSTAITAIQAAPTMSITSSNLRVAEHLAIRHRIVVLRALGRPLRDDPQLVEWAQRKLAAAAKMLEPNNDNSIFAIGEWGVGSGVSPLDAATALQINTVLGDGVQDVAAILLGLLQIHDSVETKEIERGFESLVRKHPAESARAIQLLFDRSSGPGAFGTGGMGVGVMATSDGVTTFFPPNPELTSRAMHIMSDQHPAPMEAVRVLTRALLENRIPSGFNRELILSGAETLLQRIVLETNLQSDPDGAAQLAYAIRGLASRGKTTDQVLEVLLRRLRDFELEGKSIGGDWPHEIDTQFDSGAKEKYWTNSTYFSYLRELLAKDPLQAVVALTQELLHGNNQSAVYCAHLVPKLYDAQGGKLPEQALQDFARSLAIACDRLQQDPEFESPFSSVTHPADMLLEQRIQVHRALGHEVISDPSLSKALRELVARESQQPFGEYFKTRLSVFVLEAYAEMEGMEQVPLDALLRLAWSSQTLTPEAKQLVDSVYQSRPEEFRQFFEDALISASTEHMLGLANLVRQSPKSKGIWYAIVAPLLSAPETRAQTKASIQRLLEQADQDPFMTKALGSLQ